MWEMSNKYSNFVSSLVWYVIFVFLFAMIFLFLNPSNNLAVVLFDALLAVVITILLEQLLYWSKMKRDEKKAKEREASGGVHSSC